MFYAWVAIWISFCIFLCKLLISNGTASRAIWKYHHLWVLQRLQTMDAILVYVRNSHKLHILYSCMVVLSHRCCIDLIAATELFQSRQRKIEMSTKRPKALEWFNMAPITAPTVLLHSSFRLVIGLENKPLMCILCPTCKLLLFLLFSIWFLIFRFLTLYCILTTLPPPSLLVNLPTCFVLWWNTS